MSAICRVSAICVVLCGLVSGGRTLIAASAEGSDLYVVALTYDAYPPKGQDSNHFNFAADNLSDVLSEGAPEAFNEVRIRTFRGAQATRKALADELWDIQRRADEDDVLVFYYGAHGSTSRKEGWGADCADGAIYGEELREGFGKMKCHVIAAISTCGSGGFAKPGPNENPLPPNLTVLAACKRQKSIGSQLDIALFEALAGFADRNDDGSVTLQEVADYLPLRYQEMMTADELQSPQDGLPVVATASDKPVDLVLTKSRPNRMAVVHQGEWRGAVSLGMEGKRHRVRFLGWAREELNTGYSMPDALAGPRMIDELGGYPPANVEIEGAWKPAFILSRTGKSFELRLAGRADQATMTVQRNQLRPLFGNTGFRADED